MGDNCIQAVLRIVGNPVVPTLLGTFFIDTNVNALFSLEQKMAVYNSVLVQIVVVVIKTESGETERRKDSDIIVTIAVPEEVHNSLQPISTSRPRKYHISRGV